MRDHSASLAFLRVELDRHVGGVKYAFTWTGPYAPVLSFPGRVYAVGIRFDDDADEELETHLLADQIQEAVLDSAQVGPSRTWPLAARGTSPLWARVRDGIAVWESADRSERYRIGELPAGK